MRTTCGTFAAEAWEPATHDFPFVVVAFPRMGLGDAMHCFPMRKSVNIGCIHTMKHILCKHRIVALNWVALSSGLQCLTNIKGFTKLDQLFGLFTGVCAGHQPKRHLPFPLMFHGEHMLSIKVVTWETLGKHEKEATIAEFSPAAIRVVETETKPLKMS